MKRVKERVRCIFRLRSSFSLWLLVKTYPARCRTRSNSSNSATIEFGSFPMKYCGQLGEFVRLLTCGPVLIILQIDHKVCEKSLTLCFFFSLLLTLEAHFTQESVDCFFFSFCWYFFFVCLARLFFCLQKIGVRRIEWMNGWNGERSVPPEKKCGHRMVPMSTVFLFIIIWYAIHIIIIIKYSWSYVYVFSFSLSIHKYIYTQCVHMMGFAQL